MYIKQASFRVTPRPHLSNWEVNASSMGTMNPWAALVSLYTGSLELPFSSSPQALKSQPETGHFQRRWATSLTEAKAGIRKLESINYDGKAQDLTH